MDSMIGAVSAITSKRASGATTVIAIVSTDMQSGRSTRYRRRRIGCRPWIQRLISIMYTPHALPRVIARHERFDDKVTDGWRTQRSPVLGDHRLTRLGLEGRAHRRRVACSTHDPSQILKQAGCAAFRRPDRRGKPCRPRTITDRLRSPPARMRPDGASVPAADLGC